MAENTDDQESNVRQLSTMEPGNHLLRYNEVVVNCDEEENHLLKLRLITRRCARDEDDILKEIIGNTYDEDSEGDLQENSSAEDSDEEEETSPGNVVDAVASLEVENTALQDPPEIPDVNADEKANVAPDVVIAERIPNEVLMKVMSYLSIEELVHTFPLVCKRWRDASKDPLFWHKKTFSPRPYQSEEDIIWYLKKIPTLRNLRIFNFSESNVWRLDLILRASGILHPEVESLSIAPGLPFSTERLEEFLMKTKKLTTLEIGNEMNLSGRNGFAFLGECLQKIPTLQNVSVKVIVRFNESLQPVADLMSLSSLVTLHLSTNIRDVNDFLYLAEVASPALTGLELSLPFFRDEVEFVNVFKKLLNSKPSLQKLHVIVYYWYAESCLSLLVAKHYLVKLTITYLRKPTDLNEILSQCSRLKTLVIHYGEMPDIVQLPNVKVLSLMSVRNITPAISDVSLQTSWSAMEVLQMHNIKDIESGTWHQVFRCCPNLRHVDLMTSKISHDCINSLVEYCPKVNVLNLSSTNVEDNMLGNIGKIQYFKHLNLRRCCKLTSAVVPHIVKCRTVKNINLNYNYWLVDSDIDCILSNVKSEYASLIHTGATGTFFENVQKYSESLKCISICDCIDEDIYKNVNASKHVKIDICSPCGYPFDDYSYMSWWKFNQNHYDFDFSWH